MTDRDDRVAAAYVDACLAELDALKPGNVHRFAPGHGMSLADFVRSAEASAGPIATRGARVGVRIRKAVAASLTAVGQNTNLGIILLCSPLAAAFEVEDLALRPALARVLDDLDQADAADVFTAIAAANPGGLGRADRYDVNAPATVTLRDAMAEAQDRDRIARQYVTAYDDVFALGTPALAASRQQRLDAHWSTLAVYLTFLAAFPDTHISRKHGGAAAEAIRQEAGGWREALVATRDPEEMTEGLLKWDAALKSRGVNPGTSADLTVAALFAASLTSMRRHNCVATILPSGPKDD
jgi:triphosphoribosyl-dephospho-CoA synthase